MTLGPDTTTESWLREAARLEQFQEHRLEPGQTLANGRFVLGEELGRGGMGVVYESFDHHLRERVALKTLVYLSPARLYWLKNEFRSLSEFDHPHVVGLHGLYCDAGRWFLTMDLIEGTTLRDAWSTAGAVRTLFAQLAIGVAALHRDARLHRDLKPSNVMVTSSGRVVIVDFGLVSHVRSHRPMRASDERLCGTPAYMPPERCEGAPADAAADWYAFGVMLHEALTGRLPQSGDWPSDASKLPPAGIAGDLWALCQRLLDPSPTARAGADEVLDVLCATTKAPTLPPAGKTQMFVGRVGELGFLKDCLATLPKERPRVVLVSGESGVGKTMLIEQFCHLTEESRPIAWVLRGRCLVREMVPYNALDSVIDGLARQFCTMVDREVTELVPEGAAALLRMFPVLARVGAIERAATRDALPDAGIVRQVAFSALRQLLCRLADRHTVVLLLDDIQWGDDDSALLLHHLLSGPAGPRLLCVACMRAGTTGPCVDALLSRGAIPIELGPLDDSAARSMASQLLPSEDHAFYIDSVVRESGGNPFLLAELCLYASARGDLAGGALTLELMVGWRVGRLPKRARRLAELIALAARPLTPALCLAAAEEADGGYAIIERLRRQQLVALRVYQGQEVVEPRHDRIREIIRESIAPKQRRELHRQLADAWEAAVLFDDDAIIEHRYGSGQAQAAAERCVAAAARAQGALSFDRASVLYALALQLHRFPDAAHRDLLIKLAEARASAGRIVESAEAFMTAAELSPTLRHALRCRAAHQLLIGGHMAAGLPILHDVLAELGFWLPNTRRQAFWSLLRQRMRLSIRAIEREPKIARPPSDQVTARLDALGLAAMGLSMTDPLRASVLGSTFLAEALNGGLPTHVINGLSAEAAFLGALGTRHLRRVSRLLRRANALAERFPEPFALGFVETATGMAATSRGAFDEGRGHCLQALSHTRVHGARWDWERSTAHVFLTLARFYLGDIRCLARKTPPVIQDAWDRGNRYLVASLTGAGIAAWLARDQIAEAEFQLDRASAAWPPGTYLMQHAMLALARCQVRGYQGQWQQARAIALRQLPALRRAGLLKVPLIGLGTWLTIGIGAVQNLRGGAPAALHEVRTACRHLGRLPFRPAAAFVSVLKAVVECARGDSLGAEQWLSRSAAQFEKENMVLYAAAARRARGLLSVDRACQNDVDGAELLFHAEGIVDVPAFAAMLVPTGL